MRNPIADMRQQRQPAIEAAATRTAPSPRSVADRSAVASTSSPTEYSAHGSARVIQQKTLIDGIHASPRVVAQRTHLGNLFGAARQPVPVNDDAALEGEADRMGALAARGTAEQPAIAVRSPRPVLQGKFKVGPVEYNNDNKEEIAAVPEVEELLAQNPSLPAFLDKLTTMAGVIYDAGTFSDWSRAISAVKVEVGKDSEQYANAAAQILTRFPPNQYAYIGLGGSPDIIIRAIQLQDRRAVALDLPFSNLSTAGISGAALNSLDADEAALREGAKSVDLHSDKKGEKHPVFAKDAVNQSLALEDDLVKVGKRTNLNAPTTREELFVQRPLHFKNIIRRHLDAFVAVDDLRGRKKVLLIDFTATGSSLAIGAAILQKYYGDAAVVTPFAVTNEPTVKHGTERLTGAQGVNVPHLAKVMEDTTYKNNHRLHQRFDIIDVGLGIQNHAKRRILGEESVAPHYVRPEANLGATENVDAFLKYGEPKEELTAEEQAAEDRYQRYADELGEFRS